MERRLSVRVGVVQASLAGLCLLVIGLLAYRGLNASIEAADWASRNHSALVRLELLGLELNQTRYGHATPGQVHTLLSQIRAIGEDNPRLQERLVVLSGEISQATRKGGVTGPSLALLGSINQEQQETVANHEADVAKDTRLTLRLLAGLTLIGLVLMLAAARQMYHDIRAHRQIEDELRASSEKQHQVALALERKTREVEFLRDLGELLQACHQISEAFGVVSKSMTELFPETTGMISMMAESHNVSEVVAEWGHARPGERVFPPENCWAIRKGNAHRADGSSSAVPCAHLGSGEGIASLCIPMMAQGEMLGAIHLSGGRAMEPGMEGLAITVAEQIGLALANLKLREKLQTQSVRDALTGLFNRRFMEESLDRETHRVLRSRGRLALVVLDVDKFKAFNDAFGHAAGDVVLREVAGLLQKLVRRADIPCRFGGEEFVMILPDMTADMALQRAEQLVSAVRELRAAYQDRTLGKITISAGVATFPENGDTPQMLLRAADGALYRAKRAGRDRVVVADPLGPRALEKASGE